MRNVIRFAAVVGALGAAVAFLASQHGGNVSTKDVARPQPKAVPVSESPRALESVDGTAATRPSPSESTRANPTYATASDIEREILRVISERRPSVLSINSVTCARTECEIAVVSGRADPRAALGGQADLNAMLFTEPWRDFRVLSGSTSTRATAPGARETILSFVYQPLVDLSADPRTAAEQQAACAAAWRRQTTNPTPAEYVRQYLDIADQHLALAATELGREEAERIASETNLGPLIRECGLQPQP